MKQILVIHTGEGGETADIPFMGEDLLLRRAGCGGDPERARALIHEHDGRVAAIALEGMPAALELGAARRPHELGATLAPVAQQTVVVDGSGIRAGLERWGVILADRAQPYHLDSTGALVRSPGPSPQGDGAAGGVVSTVLDLARFDRALDAGRLGGYEHFLVCPLETRHVGEVRIGAIGELGLEILGQPCAEVVQVAARGPMAATSTC